MNILFLTFHGLNPDSGVSKKIVAQTDALRQLGHNVWLCTYDVLPDGHRVRSIDGVPIARYGRPPLAAIRKRCCYGAVARFAREHGVELVYVRSWHNANPFTIHLFNSLRRQGARVVVEIPTWPYDNEYLHAAAATKAALATDRLFRRRMAQSIDAFVTFAPVDNILGQRAIRISNGFAMPAAYRLPDRKTETGKQPLRLLAVAEVHYWHGLDRAVEGLGLYKGHTPVELHIVGGIGREEMYGTAKAQGIATLMERYHIQDKVTLHGPLHGDELEEQFAMADFAIGSLGRHRSGITAIKTLKNREYAARGLAFCYSEQDDDFDSQPYVLRVPPDESPLDIERIVTFIKGMTMRREEIAATVKHLSWTCQMQRVIDSL